MSITHHHLLAVLNTELVHQPVRQVCRILDMGCGSGALISFLQNHLTRQNPNIVYELFGFDVHDENVQAAGFIERTVESLRTAHPGVDWNKRIFSIHSTELWPFADDSFDFIVSNQVLEHVAEPEFAFKQLARILAPGGVAYHLFPLDRYIYEGHLFIPFVHWIEDHDLLDWWIRVFNRLGVGQFRFPESRAPESLASYAARHADYMAFYTRHMSLCEAYGLAKRVRLRCSFRHSGEFYLAKLRTLFGRTPKLTYDQPIGKPFAPLLERLAFAVWSRVSCVTMRLEKRDIYWSSAPKPIVTLP